MNDVEYILRIVLKARDDMAKVLAQAKTHLTGFTTSVKGANKDLDGLNSRITSLNRRMGNLITRFDEAGAAIHRFASQKRDADSLLERNVELMGRLGASARDLGRGFDQASRAADRSSESSTRLGSSTRRAGRDADVSGNRFMAWARTMQAAGDNIATLDNRIRGIGLLLLAAFAQQLITALVGLGGQLVSVAGSAAMAGAALGGNLAAGAMQALPAISLLVAALVRVKQVTDAVGQAQKLTQAQFVQGANSGKKVADTADAIANAQDAVRDALERLDDARDRSIQAERQHQLAVERLREARRDAKDDLEELILAEKRAELAARGAVLSQREAAEALRQSTLRGGGLLDLDRAELDIADSQIDREETLIRLRRQRRETGAAVAAGPSNTEAIREAKRAADDAQRAFEEAQDGIRDAEQGVTRARRGLENARRDAAAGGASVATAAANLDFMLAQLSPAERRLYEAFVRIRETWKNIYRPVTDIIVDSFTRTVDRVRKVLAMPDVVREAGATARGIASSINRVVDAVTSDEMVSQFLRIAREGRRNLEPLTSIVIKLIRSFANIAEAAGPAFRRFLDFILRLTGQFEDLTDNRDKLEEFFLTGERHLEAWIMLGISAIKLFAALVGAGGAESGLRSIQDATNGIDRLTAKVKENEEDVSRFFENARRVTYEVFRVLAALAREVIMSFSPAHARNFSDILVNVVIPALGMVIRGVGLLTDIISDFLSNPVVSTLAKWGIALLIVGQIAASTIGAFSYIATVLGHLTALFAPLLKMLVATRVGVTIFWALAKAMGVVASLGVWPLAIAAGVTVLLSRLGLLDDLFQAIGGFFTAFMDGVRPALERLGDSINNLFGGDAPQDLRVLLGYLREFLRVIIEIGGRVLTALGESFGRVFGAAIDIVRGAVTLIAGILTGDLSTVLDGVKTMFKGWIDGITGLFSGPFNAIFGDAAKNAEENAREIAEKLAESAKKIREAETKLADAQREAAAAQRDLTDARRSARRELSDLQSRVEGGRLSIRSARFGVEDAKSELADLRSRGAAQGEIERAELRLAQARQTLREATRDQKRAEQDLQTFRRRGVERQPGVVSARDRASDSEKRRRELQREIDAMKEVRRLQLLLQRPARPSSLRNVVGPQGISNIERYKATRTPEQKRADDRAFKEEGERLKNRGKNLGDKMLDGLRQAFADIPIVRFFTSVFRRGLAAIRDFLGIKSPSTVFRGIGNDMLDGLISGFGGFPGRLVRIIRNAIPGAIRAVGGLIRDVAGAIGDKLGIGGDDDKKVEKIRPLQIRVPDLAKKDTTGRDTKRMRDQVVDAWQDMRTAARRGSSYIEGQFRDMRVATSRSVDRMFRDIRSSLGDMETSFRRRGDRIEKSWQATWRSLGTATFEGLSYIGGQTNKALEALGDQSIRFGLARPRADKKASGGVVGQWGQRGKDAVLTWLGKGEAVLNHWQQAAVNAQLPGGVTLGNIIDRVRGYHAGGAEQPGYARGRSGEIVAVPGVPGEMAARGILDEIRYLLRTYRGLILTDAYGQGHSSPGHTQHGDAADFSGPDRVMDRAVAYLTRKGYLVGYDGRFGSQNWPDHGPSTKTSNYHLHVEFFNKAARALGNVVSLVGRPRVRGSEGALMGIAQKAIDRVRTSANKAIDRVEAKTAPETGEYLDIEGAGSVGRTLIRVWRAMRMNFKALLGAFETGIVESGMKNLPGGDADSQGWRQERASLYPDPMNVPRSAQRFFREWRQFDRPGLTAGQVAANVQRPAAQYRGRYDQVRSQALRLLASMGIKIPDNLRFAEGGIVPGGDGSPVGILAHAGEWILNKFQQSRLAGLLGTGPRALASMLGFYGEGGSKGYAGGTEVKKPTLAQRMTSFDLSDEAIRSMEAVVKDVTTIFTKIRNFHRRFPRQVRGFVTLMDKLTSEGGVFDQLRASIERNITQRARRIISNRFRVGAGRVVTDTFSGVEGAQRALDDQRTARGELLGERDSISDALGRVRRRQRRRGLTPAQRRLLQQQENQLETRLEDAQQRVAENTQAIFEAQEAVLQANVDAQQKVVDDINKNYERQGNMIDAARRIFSALGNEDLVAQVNTQAREMMTNQAAELEGRIAAAQTAGATDLADQLTQQVQDLRTQIFESVQQELRDATERINNRAQRRLGRLDLASRMLEATGTIGQNAAVTLGGEAFSRSGIFAQRSAVLAEQRAGLQGVLNQAAAQGNVGLVQELTDALAEVDVTIRENTRAAFTARIEDVNNETNFALGVNDLNKQIVELEAQLSGNTNQAALLASAQERQTILLGQRNQLEALLAEAQAAGDQQATRDLTQAVLENKVAMLQNTVAIKDLSGAMTEPQTFASSAWTLFREAIFNGMGQILPRYNVAGSASAMAATGAMQGSGTFATSPSDISGVSKSQTINEGDTNINLYGYERPVDLTEISGAVGFARKTSQ